MAARIAAPLALVAAVLAGCKENPPRDATAYPADKPVAAGHNSSPENLGRVRPETERSAQRGQRLGGAGVADLPTTRDERVALRELHALNQTEILAGKLAQERGGSPAVRELGATLSREHETADDEVLSIAKSKNLFLDGDAEGSGTSTTTVEQEKLAPLRNLRGDAFDREFLQMMVKEHESGIAMARRSRDEVEGAELKRVLAEMLPMLDRHLERARALLTAAEQGVATERDQGEAAPGRAQGRRSPRP
jgi:putative membrane protein